MGKKNTRPFTKDKLIKGELFKAHTSFGIGGKIDYYFEPKTANEYTSVIGYAVKNKIPYVIIGNGTNILCADSGFNGIVICTKKLSLIKKTKNGIRAYVGASLPSVINKAKNFSLGGAEALSGIPGSVGGAVIMNAGAFSFNISQFVDKVCVYSENEKIILDKNDCDFGYRKSVMKEKKLPVLYVDFLFENSNKEIIEKRIGEYAKLRKESQPTGKSCGSVFQNPKGYTAGRVIESVALKGYSVGGATVSVKHANFIINNGTATAKDVVTLIDIIKKKVKKIFDIDLKEEVEYIGNFDET